MISSIKGAGTIASHIARSSPKYFTHNSPFFATYLSTSASASSANTSNTTSPTDPSSSSISSLDGTHLRHRVLALYRRIIRVGLSWNGPVEEQEYIISEARKMFRKNKDLTDTQEIKRKLWEAETRLELAIHYNIPYPKPYHIPHGVSPKEMLDNQGTPLKGTFVDSLYELERNPNPFTTVSSPSSPASST